MNPCERTDSLLSFFIDDELSPAERRFVEGHLVACPRCRRQRDDLGTVLDRVRRLPRIVAGPDFTERVLAEAMGRPAAGLEEPVVPLRPPSFPRWAPPLAAAAALGVLAFLAVTRWIGPGTAPQPVAVLEAPSTILAPEGTALSGVVGEPVVHVFGESDPSLQLAETTPPTSLGARYVREDWMFTRPTGGGEPVLTRVGVTPDHKVVVSF